MRNSKGQFAQGYGFWTGRKRSEATNQKISATLKGRPLSEETKRKMSETRKRLGIKPPSQKGKPLSAEHRRKISEANRGKKRRPMTDAEKKHLSQLHKGEKSHLWKGGVTPINRSIRVSIEYRLWRKGVLERDGSMCVLCGSTEKLEVDHIKAFADYPELRFSLENGRVLCNSCHTKTDNYGWNRYNQKVVT